MNDRIGAIVARLEGLERQNRRCRRGGIALLGASTLRVDHHGRAYFEQRLGSAKPPAGQPGPGTGISPGSGCCGNIHGQPQAPTDCWEHVPVGEITGPR